MIILAEPDRDVREELTSRVPTEVVGAASPDEVRSILDDRPADAVLFGPGIGLDASLAASRWIGEHAPAVAVGLLAHAPTPTTLRAAIRAGVHDVVEDDGPDVLAAAVQRLVTRAQRLRHAQDTRPAPTHSGRLVTVFSAKGGSGCSMVACNIAVLLATGGHDDVVLVDLDLQAGDVASMLRLPVAGGIDGLLARGEDPDADGILANLTHHPSGFWVLPAPEGPLQGRGVTPAFVRKVLGVLRDNFRYVVVDGPASFTDPLLTALDTSESVVVVSSLEITGVRNMLTTIDVLGKLGIERERLHLVLNRADSRVGLRRRDVERVLRTGIDVMIPSSTDVPRSVNGGTPLAATNPAAPVARSLSALATRLRVGDDTRNAWTRPATPLPAAAPPAAAATPRPEPGGRGTAPAPAVDLPAASPASAWRASVRYATTPHALTAPPRTRSAWHDADRSWDPRHPAANGSRDTSS